MCRDAVWGIAVCRDAVWGIAVCRDAVWSVAVCRDAVWSVAVCKAVACGKCRARRLCAAWKVDERKDRIWKNWY